MTSLEVIQKSEKIEYLQFGNQTSYQKKPTKIKPKQKDALFFCQQAVGHIQKLNKSQCKELILNSKKILLNAIKKGGSTIRDFKNTRGNTGHFQKEFQVYGRNNLNCKRSGCLGKIYKINQSNRSTFLCKKCQKI